MDRQEETNTPPNSEAKHETDQRLWVTPTFDRVELKEALSGGAIPTWDGSTYGS